MQGARRLRSPVLESGKSSHQDASQGSAWHSLRWSGYLLTLFCFLAENLQPPWLQCPRGVAGDVALPVVVMSDSIFSSQSKQNGYKVLGRFLFAGAAFLLIPLACPAATITQTLNLKYGWNAIWLEVGPVSADGTAKTASEVFGATGSGFVIDYAATPIEVRGPNTFVSDPNELYNLGGWEVWSDPPPSSGQIDNFAVRANHGYIVFVRPDGTSATSCDDLLALNDPAKVCGESAGQLAVRGVAEFYRPSWTKGEYNLVGFGVAGAPRFDALMSGSGISFTSVLQGPAVPCGNGRCEIPETETTCPVDCSGGVVPEPPLPSFAPVLRLDATGLWSKVGATDTVSSGEAYWMLVPYAFKGAGWSGPVEIDFPGAISGAWNFGSGPASLSVVDTATVQTVTDQNGSSEIYDTRQVTPSEVTFSNLDALSGDPAGTSHVITLQQVTLTNAEDPPANEAALTAPVLDVLPLEPVPEELYWRTVIVSGDPWQWEATAGTALAAGKSLTVTLGVDADRGNWKDQPNYRELLFRAEVSLDGGGTVYSYVPVVASNSLILEEETSEPVDAFTGLWAGQVTLGAVTSLADDAQAVQRTPSMLPMEIYIHVDAAGTPRLLSRGILMQTKTASEEVEPTPVLVVDETRIPYLEGIRERPDGLREGLRLETGAYDMPRDYSGTSYSFAALSTMRERPSDLPETYYLSWELGGALGVGREIYTGDAEYSYCDTNAAPCEPADPLDPAVCGRCSRSPLTLDPFHRSNPFRHAYHPDHAAGLPIERGFSIVFDESADPDLLTGVYQETTRGLTREGTNIVSVGLVELRRVSTVAELQ